MRMPTMARATVRPTTLLVASALVLGACSGETTSPTAAAPQPDAAIERTSSFVPSAASKSLIGVKDGSYVITFDPRRDQSIALGPNHLDMPANSVCRLVGSGYGADFWNRACSPEVLPVTITIVIRNASSSKPSIQFFPAMRFNPENDVELFLYAPNANKDAAKNFLMYYCPDRGKCIDESLADKDLQSYVDKHNDVVFRRIKHFSGYVVAERGDEASGEGINP
jgi:hypothetical protein